MTKQDRIDLYNTYIDGMLTEGNILSMLSRCCGNVSRVSHDVEWSIYWHDLYDLCAGYIFGTEHMKEMIEDFLTDINYHEECSKLMHDAEEFYNQLGDRNSDYYKTHWITLAAR